MNSSLSAEALLETKDQTVAANRGADVFGVIGAGFIGKMHLKALSALDVRIGAVADPSPDARSAATQWAPDAVCYTDWRQLVADPSVTAVHICTINSLHAEILTAAMEAGKHVFCEKTMTISAAEAREMMIRQTNRGQIVQIGYMKRFFPSAVWAKERMGEIGDPICATVRSFQGGLVDEGIYDSADWRPTTDGPSRTRRFASGGMLNMAGSHMLDMTAWLMGTPLSVRCHTWSPQGYDAELHAHGLFRMKSGATVHFEAALSPFSKTGVYGNGWDEWLQIDGTKGRLELFFPLWDRPADFPAKARMYLESEKAWTEPEFPAVDAFAVELKAFVEACQTGTSAAPTIRDGAVVDCWIDACYASARSGAEVEVSI